MTVRGLTGTSIAVGFFAVAAVLVYVMYVSSRINHASGVVPTRASGVPPDAVWAGGADGGDWLRCRAANAQGTRFRCEIYHDFTGELEVDGHFALAPGISDTSPVDWTTFEFFDGRTVFLPKGRRLVPDGWIEFPSVGKRQRYTMGKALSEEQQ